MTAKGESAWAAYAETVAPELGSPAADPDDALPLPIPAIEARRLPGPSELVQSLLLRADVNLYAGDGGAGKTTFLMHLACAVAAGAPALDRYAVADSCPVLFVSEEDDAGVLLNRGEAQCRGHAWDADVVLRRVHLLTLAGTDLHDLRWQLHLRHLVDRLGVGLVIFDPLADLLGAGRSQRSEDDTAIVARFWRTLTRTGCTVLTGHHVTKSLGRDESRSKLHRVRGSGAWANAARLVAWLEAGPSGLRLECLKLNRARRWPVIPFERHVVADADNPTVWHSATLRVTDTAPGMTDLTTAEASVLLHLLGTGGRPNTRALLGALTGDAGGKDDVQGAILRLERKRFISYEEGPRGAKLWGLTEGGRLTAEGLAAHKDAA